MSEFIFDILAAEKTREGVWVTCDGEFLDDYHGLRFRVKPNTTSVGKRIAGRLKGTKDPVVIARILLKELMLEADERIEHSDRVATLEENVDYFCEVPNFVKWISETSVALAGDAKKEAEEDLGN